MSSITRRSFIQQSAAAASVLATGQVWAAANGANSKIRTGVIGMRTRGWQVARAFHGSGHFEIAAICDCDQAMLDKGMKQLEMLPKKPKQEQDFQRLLDDPGLDAIVVATPDHWHAYMAVKALDAGKHVYLEKPFSYNIADGQAIMAATKRNPQQVLQVGTQHRSGPHFMEVRQFIREGGIGEVGFARCWITHPRPFIEKVDDGKPPEGFDYELWIGPAPMRPFNVNKVHYNWHFMRDLGTGDMGNWGAHWLDSCRHVLDLDLPTSAAGIGRKVVDDVKEWPDTQHVLYKFPQVDLLFEHRLWTHRGTQDMFGGVEIGGTKGTIIADRGGWRFFPPDRKAEPVKHPSARMQEPHVENFAACIAGQATPNAPAEQGHKSAILCHLGNITTVLNERVEFDPETEKLTGSEKARAMVSREYQNGWEL